MPIKYTYRGVIAPVFTPFDDNGSLNLDVIPRYAKYLAQEGVNGILVNGTSGEGMSMSVAERKLVTETWVKAAKENHQHLMVQIGGAPLPDVVELAKHAERLHVDSILCLPDLYFKPVIPEELIEYLKIVAEAAPKTPLLYYHIPMFTNVNIQMEKFLESIGDKLPTLVGIKFTSGNLEECSKALYANDKKYVIFLGNDQLISAASALGIDSFIITSVNLLPNFILEILTDIKKGDTIAKEKVESLSRTISAITKHGNWVQTMKAAMNFLTDINVGKPRAPLKPLSPETETTMRIKLM